MKRWPFSSSSTMSSRSLYSAYSATGNRRKTGRLLIVNSSIRTASIRERIQHCCSWIMLLFLACRFIQDLHRRRCYSCPLGLEALYAMQLYKELRLPSFTRSHTTVRWRSFFFLFYCQDHRQNRARDLAADILRNY